MASIPGPPVAYHARPAHQHVVAGVADDGVVAGLAPQEVRPRAARHRVVATCRIHLRRHRQPRAVDGVVATEEVGYELEVRCRHVDRHAVAIGARGDDIQRIEAGATVDEAVGVVGIDLSLPAPPDRLSEPRSPRITSLPSLPTTVSFPTPAKMKSSKLLPVMVSLPPPA